MSKENQNERLQKSTAPAQFALPIIEVIFPLSFITMKLLGCFIDFMISLINSESTGNANSIPNLNMTNFKSIAISDLNELAISKSKVGLLYF